MSAHDTTAPAYTIQEIKSVAETADLRVREMTLAEGECIPWHYHTHITDTFYCLEGELQIETPRAGVTFHLEIGDSMTVAARRPHEVSNPGQGPCRMVLVQGVGSYDFVAVPQ